ncbi:MAG TPA: rhodanese-like domain-containing protein, partial [Flavisolibacter sp.]|nr:rhodanese-like domain-containing protein [Flavisolibacter sp.]
MSLTSTFTRFLTLIVSLVLFASCTYSQSKQASSNEKERYQCQPCGYACDTLTFNQSGTCSHCQMPLVKQSTITHKTIAPSAICNYIKAHPDVILLDVRTKDEYEGKASPNFGTLQNAINIPIQELESKLTSIAHLKDKEIIVFCSHSHRSPRASYL